LAAIITLAGRFGSGKVWLRLQIPLMAILLIAALETGSRTGQICGIVVLGAALWLGALSLRAGLKVAVCVMLFYAALAAAQYLPAWLPALNIDPTQSVAVKWPFPASISTDSTSDVERWFSVKRGLEMWMTSPVLGAGLGAFRNQMLTEIGNPLVIHSSLVWMLAELGLAGTMVFLVPFAMILNTAWDERKTHSAANIALLLTLLVFGASQFVHDIFYQRIFWILFGATLFTGRFRHWRTTAA
jgi:hypothetical protein